MFKKIEANQVVYFKSDIIPAPHGFSTRIGGASSGKAVASMNFGSSVADDMVKKNIEIFTSSAKLSPFTVRTRQIHSPIIHRLTDEGFSSHIDKDGYYDNDGDGFITNQKGVSVCVRTADCLPIIMSSKDGKTVCALHAGWRGSVAGIVSCAVSEFDKLGTEPCDIYAALGPCIGKCCFEVGDDFIEEFKKSPAAHLVDKVIENRNGRHYCDLRQINYLLLLESGVPCTNIDVSNECTMHAPELFFSHRRTGFERGTMGSVVCCAE